MWLQDLTPLSITKDPDYPENLQKQAKVKESERQIDQLVDELYSLTEEEIKIVEGMNNNPHNSKSFLTNNFKFLVLC